MFHEEFHSAILPTSRYIMKINEFCFLFSMNPGDKSTNIHISFQFKFKCFGKKLIIVLTFLKNLKLYYTHLIKFIF